MSEKNNHFADEIDCYLHDVLLAHEKKQLEEHCGQCEICQAALEEGKKRFEATKNVSVSEAGEDLVRKTLAKIGRHEETRRRRWKVLRRVALSSVAALVLLFVGAQLYRASLRPTPYDLRVLGQAQFFAGSDAQVRVAVVRHDQNKGLSDVPVQIEIADQQGKFVELVSFATDDRGSAQPHFQLPPWQDGDYQLRITARPGGTAQVVTQPIHLQKDWKPAVAVNDAKLMLTSDCPVYQPGQTIHVRSLALGSLDLKPVAGKNLVFSIIDPKGTMIFKQKSASSKFGISSCDCPLAREILEGTYTVQCQLGDSEPQKLQVAVKKHVLPRFKIEVDFDRPFYQPGDRITGKVRANYFFGKPVTDGLVELILDPGESGSVVPDKKIVTSPGVTSFTFPPLRGRVLDRAGADGILNLEMRARVTDPAGQIESRMVPLTVAQDALRIEVLPEGGTLVLGFANDVAVLVTTVDGRPIKAVVTVPGLDKELQTSDLGFARFKYKPTAQQIDWTFEARTDNGLRGSRQISMKSEDELLFRTDKVIYQGGDMVRLDVWASRQEQFFVDVIKEGRTLWTQQLFDVEPWDKENASHTAGIQLPADLFGMIQFRVHQPGHKPYRPRLIHVRPPEGVRIAMQADKAEYSPGAWAELLFRLTDAKGAPVAGALSLAAVDEAVFSVLQQLPGNESAFFTGDRQSPSVPESASADDRLLLERAFLARMPQKELALPSSRESDTNRTAFTSSTHEESVRDVKKLDLTFEKLMEDVWRILAYLGVSVVVVGMGYFVVIAFTAIEGIPEKKRLIRLIIAAVFTCFVLTILFLANANYPLIESLGGGRKESLGKIRMGVELEGGTITEFETSPRRHLGL